MRPGQVVVVTGTDTGVGKTVATAALALRAAARGSVVVVKPTQTGVGPDDPGDADEVARLSGVPTEELLRLPDPLAPDSAARLRGVEIPPMAEYVDRVRTLAETTDTVVVEGAGGLLVHLDTTGGTLLDLAAALDAEVYVVCRAGLGTLNHTCLTVEALRGRGVEPAGLVLGAWPPRPSLAEQQNLVDLPRVGAVPLVGVLPEGAGGLDRAEFSARAPGWFQGVDR